MTKVSLNDVSKTFKNSSTDAVSKVNLKIHDEEFLVILGPSGSGKSTLLRLIAGLEDLTSGDVYFDSEIMNEVSPRDRNISMVFQNYALFPHMNVFDNIVFPLVSSGKSKLEITEDVNRIASILKISDLLERKPSELSGGEQQRISLGRAIIKKPKVFLMDEPLSNLDASLRAELRTEIKKLHEDLKITFVYVTHDQTEAMTMADRIAVIKDGKLLQVGTPKEIYNSPNHSWIGSFIGSPPMNLIHATAENDSLVINSQTLNLKISSSSQDILIGIRPENITINSSEGRLTGTVLFLEYLGDSNIINVQIEKEIIKIKVSNDSKFSVGDKVWINFSDNDINLFDNNGKSLK